MPTDLVVIDRDWKKDAVPLAQEPTVKPRVTFCAYDWPGSVCGPSSWIERLLPSLCRLQIECNCVVMCWSSPGPLLKALKAEGVDCRVIACEGPTEHRIESVLQMVREANPNVFVPNLCVPALFAARWVREAGIPTVGVLHSDDDFYRGVCHEFADGVNEFSLTELVCVSEALRSEAVGHSGPLTGVSRIGYGVTVPALSVMRGSESFRIAYVGRLVEEQKRISEVTKCLIRATREIPNVSATIIGDGADRKRVEALLSLDGDSSLVQLVGRVEPNEIWSYLLQCDAIVLLSEYEGLPIALLEAMACGVVPICLNMRSGIPELVRHDETGLIVENREDGFVAAVRRLKDDTELWQRLSSNARQLIVSNYSHEASTKQWAELLGSLANRQSRVSRISIPSRFGLPPVNPALAAEDVRNTNPARLGFASEAKRLAGLLKRSLRKTGGQF